MKVAVVSDQTFPVVVVAACSHQIVAVAVGVVAFLLKIAVAFLLIVADHQIDCWVN